MKRIIDISEDDLRLCPRYINGDIVLSRIVNAVKNSIPLDNIRSEIEEYKSTIDNAISEDELKIEGMKEAYADCLKIIDKCKEKVMKYDI